MNRLLCAVALFCLYISPSLTMPTDHKSEIMDVEALRESEPEPVPEADNSGVEVVPQNNVDDLFQGGHHSFQAQSSGTIRRVGHEGPCKF